MRVIYGLLTLTAAALFALGPIQSAGAASNPIHILQCFVIQPKALSRNAGGTQIVYVNQGPMTATEVTFSVAYRNAANHYVRMVTDEGMFNPGVKIDHRFNLYSDVLYAGKQTQSCRVVKVKWRNGRTSLF